MEDTRHKLEEAKFFLGFLKPNYGKEKKFDFYLSAFFNAARAVTWIMRAEYGKFEGWAAWYDALQPDAEEERLLDGITDARNRSLKSEPLRTLVRIISRPQTDSGDEAEGASLFARIQNERIPVKIFSTSAGKFRFEAVIDGQPVTLHFGQTDFDRRLREFPDQHIVSVCNRYYDWLSKLVADCEAKFGR